MKTCYILFTCPSITSHFLSTPAATPIVYACELVASDTADLHFLALQEHAVDLVNSQVCSLLRLKVHEPIASALPLQVDRDLARQDVPERAERIVESLMVDGLVQVLSHHPAQQSWPLVGGPFAG